MHVRLAWLRNSLLLLLALAMCGTLLLTVLTVQSLRPMPSDLSQLTRAQIKPQLLDRNGLPLTITYQNRWNAHQQVSLHRVPAFLQRAFLLAEDKRFYQHRGIDWLARLNALWQNLTAMKGVRGASTITEQVVRMIHQRPRSAWSRWVEGWEARALEQHVDKATILEFYINQVPYAAQRRGARQAARYYFDRDLETLSEKEMLALAVLVRAPSRFDLHKGTQRIQGRLNTLITRAVSAGLIADSEMVAAQPLVVTQSRPILNVSHFANWVYRNNEPDVHQIHTTLDSDLQAFGQRVLEQQLASLKHRQVTNGGLIVVDHQTSEVLVWAVGDNGSGRGDAYDTILVERQPGSTLKPFVYATAMERGWTAATTIDDSPLQEGVGQGMHAYRNYSNSHYGAVSLREALGNSLNIPAIKAAQFVGVESLISTLDSLGIHSLEQRSVDYGHGIALGNAEISLRALTSAYATLAHGGRFRPLSVTKDSLAQRGDQVFSPEVSSLIGNILSDADARAKEFGRSGALNLPVQTAVKTGTSSDYRDAWVMGYNHRYVVGVWMGNLDSQPMKDVTGSTGPALVMRAVFSELNRNSETKPLFFSRRLVSRTVCVGSGMSADDMCASRREWFLPDTLPGKQEMVAEPREYRITLPVDQMRVARDPRIPNEHEALEFALNHEEGMQRVEWIVDGKQIAATSNGRYYWPLRAGQHTVQARIYDRVNTEPKATSPVTLIVK